MRGEATSLDNAPASVYLSTERPRRGSRRSGLPDGVVVADENLAVLYRRPGTDELVAVRTSGIVVAALLGEPREALASGPCTINGVRRNMCAQPERCPRSACARRCLCRYLDELSPSLIVSKAVWGGGQIEADRGTEASRISWRASRGSPPAWCTFFRNRGTPNLGLAMLNTGLGTRGRIEQLALSPGYPSKPRIVVERSHGRLRPRRRNSSASQPESPSRRAVRIYHHHSTHVNTPSGPLRYTTG